MNIIRKYTTVFPVWVLTTLMMTTAFLPASGCSPYRINIQQGNFIDQKKVDQVKTGMNRNQVKFLLGTPMIADSFHSNRWDYVYYVKFGKTNQVVSRKVTVYFDGDIVTEVELDNADAKAQNQILKTRRVAALR